MTEGQGFGQELARFSTDLSEYTPGPEDESEDSKSEIYRELGSDAEGAGREAAINDVHKYNYEQKPLPSAEFMRSMALRQAASDIKSHSHVFKAGADRKTLEKFYVREFMEAYSEFLNEALGHGLLAEEVIEIDGMAQQDARSDLVLSSDLELTCYATIRVQERKPFDVSEISLSDFVKYVEHYRSAYRKEKDRLSRSNVFQK